MKLRYYMRSLLPRIPFNYVPFGTILFASALSFWSAYEIRFDFRVPKGFYEQRLLLLPYVAFIKTILFFLLRGHATNWRYVGITDIPVLVLHSFICALLLFTIPFISDALWVPRGVIVMDFFISLVLIGGIRLSFRFFRERLRVFLSPGNTPMKKPAIIIGAGDAGEMIIREIIRNPQSGLEVKALFDDDDSKRKLAIHGIKVVGNVEDVAGYIAHVPVDLAIVAIPTANKAQMQRIYNLLSGLNLNVKTLPGIHEIIEGSTLTQLRDVEISDLLGREEIKIDSDQVYRLIADRVVIVTGAGGSIGSELSRQILRRQPRTLILLDRF